MRKPPPIITLLTDFGTRDHYVSSMKGVILSINPRCVLVDITHQVAAQDIREGAHLLASSCACFPKGTIHLAVVDPGVGGPRRPILVVTERYLFVGPDNGLLSLAARREKVGKVIVLTNRKYFLPEVSSTFHGRDLFAPVAGHLTLGVRPEALGPQTGSWQQLDAAKPRVRGQRLVGEIVRVDTFGNLITNIGEGELSRFLKGRPPVVRAGEMVFRDLKRGYWEAKGRAPVALLGSGGFLEISINEGSAQKASKMKKGDSVEIKKGR